MARPNNTEELYTKNQGSFYNTITNATNLEKVELYTNGEDGDNEETRGARVYSLACWSDDAADMVVIFWVVNNKNAVSLTYKKCASQLVETGYGTSTSNPNPKTVLTSSNNTHVSQDMAGNPFIRIPPGGTLYASVLAQVTSGDTIEIYGEYEEY